MRSPGVRTGMSDIPITIDNIHMDTIEYEY